MSEEQQKFQRYDRVLGILLWIGLGLVLLYNLFPEYGTHKTLVYLFVGAGSLFTLIYHYLLPKRLNGPRKLAIEGFIDIFAIAFLMVITEGHSSLFYFYFFLIVAGSALIFGQKRIILETSLISVLLLLIFGFEYLSVPDISQELPHHLVHVGILIASLWIVAFWSANLAAIIDKVLKEEKALTVRNQELYEKESKAHRELVTIQKTSANLLSNLNLDQVLRDITHGLTSGVGYDRAAIFLIDREKKIIEEKYASGLTPNLMAYERSVSLLDGKGMLFECIWQANPCAYNNNKLVIVPVIARDKSEVHKSTVCKNMLCPLYNSKPKNGKIVIRALPKKLKTLTSHKIAEVLDCADFKILGAIVVDNFEGEKPITEDNIASLQVFAQNVAIALENARLFEEIEQKVAELNSLNKVMTSLTSTLNLEKLLDESIDQAMRATKAESGSIVLLGGDSRTLRIKAARGLEPQELRIINQRVGTEVAKRVMTTNESLIIAENNGNSFRKDLRRAGVFSLLSTPLKMKNKVIGVLNIYRKSIKSAFTEEDLKLASSFAAQVSTAVENAKLSEDLQNTVLGTVSALAAAVEAKDPYTFGHSWSVTNFSAAIAEELALSEWEIKVVRTASTLHDIGKLGVEGYILNKPGPLNTKERNIINLHPIIGVDILKSLSFLKNVLPLIYSHHERWDGTGYPLGKREGEIPLGARIIAVADSFNAMVSKRPYRPAKSYDEAVKEIRKCSGSQFDPDVVEAFLRVNTKTTTSN